jgi:Cdc6-like AAA superfamily ATPase
MATNIDATHAGDWTFEGTRVAENTQDAVGISLEDLVPDRALIRKNDTDQLDHQPIAARVAELLARVDTPVNVALFGPWGSGKTSFAKLIQDELKKTDPRAAFVHYDAWRFKGEPLVRNFISYSATCLGKKPGTAGGAKYHEGLYESAQRAKLDLRAGKSALSIAVFGLTLLILSLTVVALSLAVGVAAQIFHQDPMDQIGKILPGLLPAAVIGSVLSALAKAVADDLRIQVTKTPPTQEQLRDRFKELVHESTNLLGHSRLIFYVDELDRCPKTEVTETLAAIRNLFDEDRCVFIVAADRDALTSALDAVNHGIPNDPENPYRSTATEFFDKVFQFQISLPPLRGSALSAFAAGLVSKKGGIWGELGEMGILDDVIYVLIPSHVRSPRRVKVLLNNFAANARIAQSRKLSLQAHALELAKLTALQTEFPLFAAHLQSEPRLLHALVHSEEELQPDSSLEALATKFALEPRSAPTPGTATPAPSLATPASATAPQTPSVAPVAKAAAKEDGEAIRAALHALFRQYLIRVRDYPDPRRDVLFLQPVSETVALSNDELGTMIENVAIDDPEAVADAIIAVEPDERRKAMRLLAQLVPPAFGQERSNIVTAILLVAESLDYDLGNAKLEVVNAIEQLDQRPGLEEDQLVRILALALGNRPGLASRLLLDPRLFLDVEQVGAVASLSHRLPSDQDRERVWGHVKAVVAEPAAWRPAIELLPENTALDFFASIEKSLWDEARKLSEEDQTEFVQSLLDALAERQDFSTALARRVLTSLVTLDQPGATAAARDDTDLLGLLLPSDRRTVALIALAHGEPSDWKYWVDQLGEEPAKGDDGRQAVLAIVKMLGLLAAVGSSGESIRPLFDRLVRLAKGAPVRVGDGTTEKSIRRVLGPWPEVSAPSRLAVFDSVMALKPLGKAAAAEAESAVVENLEEGLGIPVALQIALDITATLASRFELASLERLGDAIVGTTLGFVAAAPGRVPVTATQIALARSAVALGSRFAGSRMPSTQALIEACRADSSTLKSWLLALPPIDQVGDVAERLIATPIKGQGAAFEGWSKIAPETERTTLLCRFVDAPDTEWLYQVVRGEEATVVGLLVDRIKNKGKGPASDRADLGRLLIVAGPKTRLRVDPLLDLIGWTLQRATKADRSNAIRLVDAFDPNDHGLDAKLAKVFRPFLKDMTDLTDSEKKRLAGRSIKVPAPRRGLSIGKR